MTLTSKYVPDLSRLEFHRRTPEISLEKHMRHMRIQLGEMLASTQRIYLDLRFWILLRDVSIGRSDDSTISHLLTYLKDSVRQGKTICPISDTIFIELLKQSDESTRFATAKLIDELSMGVTLIPFDDRVRQELCNSLFEQAGVADLIPTNILVWNKLAYVLGEVHPHDFGLSPEEELAVQKSIADEMWEVPLTEMVSLIGERKNDSNWNSIANRLNLESRVHQATIGSYTQAFRAEFEGSFSLFKADVNKILKESDKYGGSEFGAKLAHLSPNKRFETFVRSVPTLHIHASCHAAVRWDQKRNLTGNDLLDFHHAHAALAYCDVFLTEKPLSSMLAQHHLGLSKYKCQTFWSPGAALSWLLANSN